MAYKKKLYRLSADKEEDKVTCQAQQTKRKQVDIKVSPASNERNIREQLSNKIAGSHMGLWLLVPEYQQLGTWEMLKSVFEKETNPLAANLGMQMVNESALCVNRIRRKDSLCNQGFSMVNGLSFLATDENIHQILDNRSIAEFEQMQQTLMQLRKMNGHYIEYDTVLALDPHRIPSATKRNMPKKKKRPEEPSKKMLQTFFCNDVVTKQPLGFSVASTGTTCTKATIDLIQLIEKGGINQALILADKEHFTQHISEYFYRHPTLDMLIPAPNYSSVTKKFNNIVFQPLWAGYAIGETSFNYKGSTLGYRLLVQREGERPEDYRYSAFITTSRVDAQTLLTKMYDKRWSIEEFFNFEGDMGWNRASTFNLNVRYGKQSLALLAQAATHQIKLKLPTPYSQWTAASLSEKVLTNMEGDIRVKDDKIIVTYYKDHEQLGLRDKYHNITQQLENKGISPKIPWLFDYKLEFLFK